MGILIICGYAILLIVLRQELSRKFDIFGGMCVMDFKFLLTKIGPQIMKNGHIIRDICLFILLVIFKKRTLLCDK